MANEFDVMSRMARIDAIDAYRITVCRVAGLAPAQIITLQINISCGLISKYI